MKIADFIRNQIILPRLQDHSVLVVYDPEGRYLEVCQALADEKYALVNASESSIQARRAALNAIQSLAGPQSQLEGLLIYIPAKAPLTDDEKQQDPFAVYGACGAVFPDPQNDGDTYQSLCLKAKPEFVTQIQKVFANDPNPSFAVIDAIGGGEGWPTLETLLRADSARAILLALLSPNPQQKAALLADTAWFAEAGSLLETILSMPLMTKVQSWPAVSEELWRFLLFSEFTFDLPGELPQALDMIPKAPPEAKPMVYDLCDDLRNDLRSQGDYVEQAALVEGILQLPQKCKGLQEFGQRQTFPFEAERCCEQAVQAFIDGEGAVFREALRKHQQSHWDNLGENELHWSLLQAADRLINAIDKAHSVVSAGSNASLSHLLDIYTAELCEVDRCHREFEQVAVEVFDDLPSVAKIKTQSRQAYQAYNTQLQQAFLRLIQNEGWPESKQMANKTVFDRWVTPALRQNGHRVAIILIDALRFELGSELAGILEEWGQVSLDSACASLPTITPVGMVSLLPEADMKMSLIRKENKAQPEWEGAPIMTVAQRMDVLRSRYGERFAELKLNLFAKGSEDVAQGVDLLVLRSNDMDSEFEANPESALSLISRTLNLVRAAVKRLQKLGFEDVFIFTDHGFYMNVSGLAGDVCAMPTGDWINVHNRMLLGDGNPDASNLVLPADFLGIKGAFNQAAVPRAMVAYRAGVTYFHGGLSLQEAVVPVIAVKITPLAPKRTETIEVRLSYRGGREKITTRLPVININVRGQTGLFEAQKPVEFLVEAHDRSGQVVGEAKVGDRVNPATRTITLNPGESAQIALRMDLNFEGHFEVKALDPSTGLALSDSLPLETDYTV